MADVQHADLTTIHPFAYVSAVDPGAVGSHKAWIDTSVDPLQPVIWLRNSTNDDWISLTNTLLNILFPTFHLGGVGVCEISMTNSIPQIDLIVAGVLSISLDGVANQIKLLAPNGLTLNGATVTLGAPDSGGVGFRVLRVPN